MLSNVNAFYYLQFIGSVCLSWLGCDNYKIFFVSSDNEGLKIEYLENIWLEIKYQDQISISWDQNMTLTKSSFRIWGQCLHQHRLKMSWRFGIVFTISEKNQLIKVGLASNMKDSNKFWYWKTIWRRDFIWCQEVLFDLTGLVVSSSLLNNIQLF